MRGSLFVRSTRDPALACLGDRRVACARVMPLFLVLLMVFGCAAPARNGTSFVATVQKLGPPRTGHARIVVFREKGYAGLIDPGWQIKLDDVPIGDVKTGTFVFADRPAGSHQLSMIGSNLPRPSRQDVNAAAGRSYYFKVDLNEKGRLIMAGSASAGVAGLLLTSVAAAATDERGAYDFTLVDEATARQALAEYSLAE
jgi:uncharacterized protein DUF2846